VLDGSTRLNETSLLEPSSLLNLSLASNRQSPKAGNNIKIHESPPSYNLPPTENLKFDHFLNLILIDSQLSAQKQKEEIAKYVRALETNYTDKIRLLKEKNEKLVKQLKGKKSEKVNEATEKSDLEQLFVGCIEEVRKEVMRRRFRTEVANRKATRLAG